MLSFFTFLFLLVVAHSLKNQLSNSVQKIESLEDTVLSLRSKLTETEILLTRKTDNLSRLIEDCNKLKNELSESKTQISILTSTNNNNNNNNNNILQKSDGQSSGYVMAF
jgi:predicted RNase H-like nuclease (RuvC/YqgF family)